MTDVCNCGPARQRPHTALKRTLTTKLRRLHFEVDVERVVPFVSTTAQAGAILHAVACAPDNYERLFIDVTVRAPHATKCRNSSSLSATAAVHGEADKLRRHGEHVTCLPIGRCCRKGTEAEETLWRTAQTAARTNAETSASRLLQAVKKKLQRAVLRATADVAILAMFGTSGEMRRDR